MQVLINAMKKAVLLSLLLLASGCAAMKSISEIKSDEFVGETVSISGTVIDRLIIGDFSGYTVKDANNDTIFVYSESLPQEGDFVFVKGDVEKNILVGYYLKAE